MGVGGEDIVDSRGHALAALGAAVPDGLTTIGGGGIDRMSGGVGDVDDAVAGETLDGDGAVVVGTHGIGESIDIVEREGLGVGGGRAIDLQAIVGADIDLAGALVDGEGDHLVGKQRAVGRSEVFQLVEAVGGDEVEAAVGGAHPFAVGAVDSDGGDAPRRP